MRLSWVGWVMLGAGGMLVYAGMTGQSLVGELQAVLNGKSPAKAGGGPAPIPENLSTWHDSQVLPVTPSSAPAHPATITRAVFV